MDETIFRYQSFNNAYLRAQCLSENKSSRPFIIICREAKKDPVGRQAYMLLTNIHESFEQIAAKILATDRTRREVTEHEAKLAAMASRSLNINKLQVDLDAIRQENECLEQRLKDNSLDSSS